MQIFLKSNSCKSFPLLLIQENEYHLKRDSMRINHNNQLHNRLVFVKKINVIHLGVYE